MNATLSPRLTYYLMRGSVSFFYQMWLTVTLLYHTTRITDDPLQLVLLGVVLEGTIFLLEIPTGVVADAYSRKWSVIFGIFLTGVAYLLEGMFAIYATVLLAQFLYGVGFTFYSGANDTWIADEVGTDDAPPVFLRGSQIGLVCGQLGILSAIAIGTFGIALPLIISGLGLMVIACLLIPIMREDNFTPEKSTTSVWGQFTGTFQRSTQLLGRGSRFWIVVMVGVITGLSVGGYDRLFTPHFLLNYSTTIEPIIWFGILSAVVSLSSAVILGRLRQRTHLIDAERVPRLIAWLYGGTIVGNIVFILAGQFWLALVAYWFSQMLRATTRPLIIIWVNQITTSQVRASAISMYWQSNSLGQIIGAPFIGLLGNLTTLRIALMTSVLALSPAVWLLSHTQTPDSEKV
ncbi:MAG: MFS transporter [Chloroflexota bacterium]